MAPYWALNMELFWWQFKILYIVHLDTSTTFSSIIDKQKQIKKTIFFY